MPSIKIGSNTNSMVVQRNLELESSKLATTFQRLSSGQRINEAKDDPAGLAVAQKLNSDSRVYSQAILNVNDGISLINIADGALGELKNISIRQRELATQAANGIYSVAQTSSLNNEANQLVQEYNRIVQSTDFNQYDLFCKGPTTIRIQAGMGINGSIPFILGDSLARKTADGTFQNEVVYSTGVGPRGVTTGDYNSDGKQDMIVSNGSSDTVSYFAGNGDGTFKDGVLISTSYSSGAYSIQSGDFNNDGKLDFASAAFGMAEMIVCLGKGDGTFQTPIIYSTGQGPQSLALGDFNGDHNIDIVSSNKDIDTISVFLGNGNGTFQNAVAYSTSTTPRSVTVGDFNSDGRDDIATTATYGDKISLFISNSNGTFQNARTVSCGESPYSLISGDFDADGKLDIITDDLGGTDKIGILKGNGDGTFAYSTMLAPYGSFPTPALTGDFNSDGKLDFVATHVNVAYSTIYFGNGDCTFKEGAVLNTSAASWGAAAADFNGDSRLDIVTADVSTKKAGIFIGNGSASSTISRLDLTSRTGALEAMRTIDSTIDRISLEMGNIGATQCRLTTAANTLYSTRENYQAAGSRITDIDVAQESANLVREQIIQKAASSVLAQANQNPQIALTLLKV